MRTMMRMIMSSLAKILGVEAVPMDLERGKTVKMVKRKLMMMMGLLMMLRRSLMTRTLKTTTKRKRKTAIPYL